MKAVKLDNIVITLNMLILTLTTSYSNWSWFFVSNEIVSCKKLSKFLKKTVNGFYVTTSPVPEINHFNAVD